ncbi:MAG: hypothetical protein QM817_10280 [Archangium sp.]
MSGGLKTIDIGGGNGSKGGTSQAYDPFPDEAAKAARLAQEAAAKAPQYQAPPAAPDLADLAFKDATTGRVRRARSGSTADSILGKAIDFGQFIALLSSVYFALIVAWLRNQRGA